MWIFLQNMHLSIKLTSQRIVLHPFLTNRHRSSSKQVQLTTERYLIPLFVPHTYFPFTTKLIQRYWRECYRCANMEIMMMSMWNDGNSIRMVETRSDDHSLQIACNRRHFAFQITYIASPFKGESKQNHSTTINKEQRNTHRRPYLIDYNPQITIKHHFIQQSLLSKCNHSTQPSIQGCDFFGISFTVTVNRKSLKRLPFYGNP